MMIYDESTTIVVDHDSLYGLKLALEAIIQDIEYGDEGPCGLGERGSSHGLYDYSLNHQ